VVVPMLRVVVIALLAAVAVGADSHETTDTNATVLPVDGSCDSHVCDTKYGFYKFIAEKLPDGTCGCVPFYKSGPCHQRMCEDGYLVLEQDSECKCVNTCDGKECKLPHIPMIDYRRQVEGLCKCISPPKAGGAGAPQYS